MLGKVKVLRGEAAEREGSNAGPGVWPPVWKGFGSFGGCGSVWEADGEVAENERNDLGGVRGSGAWLGASMLLQCRRFEFGCAWRDDKAVATKVLEDSEAPR